MQPLDALFAREIIFPAILLILSIFVQVILLIITRGGRRASSPRHLPVKAAFERMNEDCGRRLRASWRQKFSQQKRCLLPTSRCERIARLLVCQMKGRREAGMGREGRKGGGVESKLTVHTRGIGACSRRSRVIKDSAIAF